MNSYTLSRPVPLGWVLVAIVLAVAIGIGIGGGFCMRQADQVIDGMHARDKANIDALLEENAKLRAALAGANNVQIQLLDRVRHDEALCAEKNKTVSGALAFRWDKP